MTATRVGYFYFIACELTLYVSMFSRDLFYLKLEH